MVEYKESKFYKLLQDFSINNDKKTFLELLGEFYNRTEGIIIKNEDQDNLIKELRDMYIQFNEEGINENIVMEKVNYFLENSIKIQNIIEKMNTNAININNLKSEVNIGCVIRPTSNINDPWQLFQDAAHESKGITSAVYNNDGTITLNFDKTYKKIRSFNTFPDEMMKMYGFEVGASTALNSAKLFLISNLIVGTTLTFKQSDQSITISKAGHIESATWTSGTGVVVKFKNVPKQTPNSVQVTLTNALNLKATCSVSGNREITIKFYKTDGQQITDITGNWSCMIDANFTGLVDFNCTSVYDSNILTSMALMYNAQMKQ